MYKANDLAKWPQLDDDCTARFEEAFTFCSSLEGPGMS